MDPVKFFSRPKTPGQKQYEALRSFYVDHLPGPEVIRRFGYTSESFNSLKKKFKSGDLTFFVTAPRGPKGPRINSETHDKIIAYRKQGISTYQIAEILET